MEWFQELGDESVKTAKDTEVDNDEDVIKANKLTALKRHTAGLDQGPGSCNSSPVSNGAAQQACTTTVASRSGKQSWANYESLNVCGRQR